jgi:hypothetical protein
MGDETIMAPKAHGTSSVRTFRSHLYAFIHSSDHVSTYRICTMYYLLTIGSRPTKSTLELRSRHGRSHLQL